MKPTLWTPGPAEMHRPKKSHMVALWTMWILAALLLLMWLWGMVTWHLMGGWLHAFLAGAVVLAAFCIFYGFKYCEYLQRPVVKKIRSLKLRRSKADKTQHNS